MKEVFITALYCSVPVSIMGMAAYLLAKDAPLKGWFLLAAFFLAGSMSWKVN